MVVEEMVTVLAAETVPLLVVEMVEVVVSVAEFGMVLDIVVLVLVVIVPLVVLLVTRMVVIVLVLVLVVLSEAALVVVFGLWQFHFCYSEYFKVR